MNPVVRGGLPGGHLVAVLLVPGAIGLHVGVWLHLGGAPVFLHLAWHLDLRCEAPSEPAWWVVPQLSRAAQLLVSRRAAMVAVAHERGEVPYALNGRDVRFDDQGALLLGGRHGLTCASFVAVLFESAGVPLVDIDTWNQRDAARLAEDEDAQRRLVAALRQEHPEQAERVAPEIGCARLRPEEVAAASGMEPRPVAFPAAAAAGASVRRATAA